MMGTSRLVAASMAVVLLATPALAQPAKPPTAQQKQQAGDLVKQAIAKSQGGDHQAAIDLYLGAYAIVPLPLLLSNIGSEYKMLKKPVEALKYFCKYLEAEPTGSNASYATSEAKVLQIELGNKAVDDTNVCAPAPVPTPDPVVQPPVVERYGTETQTDPGRPLTVAGMAVAGLGVVGLGVGVYFGLKARSISNEISDHDQSQPWPSDINQKEKDGQAAEDKQIILMTVGGIALAGGVVLYMLGRAKSSEKRVAITPTATPSTVGVMFSGSF